MVLSSYSVYGFRDLSIFSDPELQGSCSPVGRRHVTSDLDGTNPYNFLIEKGSQSIVCVYNTC